MKKLLLIITILSLLLTGCWDVVDINRRIFVSNIGIDLNPDFQESEMEGNLHITYVYPNINAFGSNASQDRRMFNIYTTAATLMQASRNFVRTEEFPLYWKHLKIIAISQNILEDESLLRQIIDGLNRDKRINKKVLLVAVRGRARDILDKNSEEEYITFNPIHNILLDNRSAARFTEKSLSDFIMDLDYNNATSIPLVSINENDEIGISGGAVIKDFILQGYISDFENRGLEFLLSGITQELIDAPYKDELVSIGDISSKYNKDVEIGEDNIKVKYKVKAQGWLQEYTHTRELREDSQKIIKEMEDAGEKVILEDIENTVYKLQKELNADLLGIGGHLQKYHPRLWDDIEEDWDEIFPYIDIEVDVDLRIRNTGLSLP